MNNKEEQQLVALAIKGDRDAFGMLYCHTVATIIRYISRRISDIHLVEDLTSDVYTHALSSIHRYRHTGKPFIAWLYRIAQTRVADYFRRLYRLPNITTLDDVYVAVLPNLDTRLMEQELNDYLYTVIIALTENQRQVIMLRFGEGKKTKEVAHIMSKNVNATKQLQHRALSSMKRRLLRQDFNLLDYQASSGSTVSPHI